MDKIKVLIALLVLCGLTISSSCSSDDDDDDVLGNWTKTTPFKGQPRSGAASFTIGTKVFVGLGYDGDDYLSDFYVFDSNSGYWEEKKSFPGVMRERSVAFSINGKGYIGLGYNRDLDKEELGDFWEYDPSTDEWTQVASFGGTARYYAIGFAIGSKGYVGTGYDGDKYNSDFWVFDPTVVNESTGIKGSWNEINSYPGEKIQSGLAFVIDEKAYVCTGQNNGSYNNDFWEFNPTGSEVWTQRAPTDDDSDYDEFKLAVRRHQAVAFTLNGKAYIVGGLISETAVKTVYEYDPSTDLWDDKTSFEGSARSLAVAYVLDGRAFYGTGQNGSSRYDDIWEFKPNEEYDEDY